MLDFIHLLIERHRTVLSHIPEESALAHLLRKNIISLALSEAFLQKGRLTEKAPGHPLQIAVIGPTQAGKSTVVNLLLQDNLAAVSPLAGFTVHPQGFSLGVQEHALDWLFDYFKDYQRCPQDELPRDRYGFYALTAVESPRRHPLPACVVWDTPDFDSIDAQGYRNSVLRTAALADMLLVVLSKDKYADQSVWEMLSLLEPLGQPTVICLNKITEKARPIILKSLQEKWQNNRRDQPFALTTLTYHAELSSIAALQDEQGPLLESLKRAARKTKRRQHQRQTKELLRLHWPSWTAPVIAEHNALHEWNGLIDRLIKEGLEVYRQDYLDHPQHYETFQRALAELLTLLEIPGVAIPLMRARQVLTWPIRQVMGLGRLAGTSNGRSSKSHEVMLLIQIMEHLFIQLSETVLLKYEEDQDQQSWWKDIGGLLRSEKEILSSRFKTAVRAYHQDFRPQIQQAAQRLYHRLEEMPGTLNSLRATRVTTDAVAVALTLKTGGIGLHDFILTPAILSLTSMMTEGALGHYMNKVAADLKQRQFNTVQQQLFHDVVQASLRELPENLDTSDKFDIPLETLKAAESQLEDKRYGLQTL